MPLNHAHVLGRKLKHRTSSMGLLTASVLLASAILLILALHAGSAYAANNQTQTSSQGGAVMTETPATTPGLRATISADGRTAIAPAGAPLQVQKAIWAANKITRKPYIYGGGHATFKKIAKGYDCSSTVSYALGNAGLLKGTPLDSSSFMRWGDKGKGAWVTVYTNPGHAYAYIAGLRLDTSGRGERGPRWRTDKRSNRGFRARHPEGF